VDPELAVEPSDELQDGVLFFSPLLLDVLLPVPPSVFTDEDDVECADCWLFC
jgi:hypothetical protein